MNVSRTTLSRTCFAFLVGLALALSAAAPRAAVPIVTLDEVRSPADVAPGTIARLRLGLRNYDVEPVTDIVLALPLPSDVSYPEDPRLETDCDFPFIFESEPEQRLSFVGRLGAFEECAATFDVRPLVRGVTVIDTEAGTSSAGVLGTATATITADDQAADVIPGIEVVDLAGPVRVGERVRLRATLLNARSGSLQQYAMTMTLPPGLELDAVPAVVNTCSPGGAADLTGAVPGSRTLSLAMQVFQSPDECIVEAYARVVGLGERKYPTARTGLTAVVDHQAALSRDIITDTVYIPTTQSALTLRHEIAEPVAPGGQAAFRYILANHSRAAARDLAFMHELEDVVAGLAGGGGTRDDSCSERGTVFAGSGLVSVDGLALGPGETCSFTVDVDVPAGAARGSYASRPGDLDAVLDGTPRSFPATGAALVVSGLPALSLAFDHPGTAFKAGDDLTATLRLVNTSQTDTISGLALNLSLPGGLSLKELPGANVCGTGSSASGNFTQEPILLLTNASLGPGASCELPYTFTTGADLKGPLDFELLFLNATFDQGEPAYETTSGERWSLDVVAAPAVILEATPALLSPGGFFDLSITVRAGAEDPATAIALDLALSPLGARVLAEGTPVNGVCGSGSSLTGTDTLALRGGSLAAGESCTMTVTVSGLRVPPGFVTLQPATATATVGGETIDLYTPALQVQSSPLQATLTLSAEQVFPGDSLVATYTLQVDALAGESVSIVSLSHDLRQFPGTLTASSELSTCPGHSFVGTATRPVLSTGPLVPGTLCTYSFELDGLESLPPGDYMLGSGPISSTSSYGNQQVPRQQASFAVVSDVLRHSVALSAEAVAPEGTFTVTHTLSNDGNATLTDLSFNVNDLAVFPGLATGELPEAPCGQGSTLAAIDGGYALTGASLGAGDACSITVPLVAPATLPGSPVTFQSSTVSGKLSGEDLSGAAVRFTVAPANLVVTRQLPGAVYPGTRATMALTLTNAGTTPIQGVRFRETLGKLGAGISAANLPLSDPCGPGSSLSGTTELVLEGASLAAGGSCTMNIELAIADDATGTFELEGDGLVSFGAPLGQLPAGSLPVTAPPSIGLSLAQTALVIGDATALTIKVDNASGSAAVGSVAVTVPLGDGLIVADPAKASSDCGEATVTAEPGSSSVEISGASVEAASSCAVSVKVEATRTGDATLNAGEVETAYGSLTGASVGLAVASGGAPRKLATPAGQPARVAFTPASNTSLCRFKGEPSTRLAPEADLPRDWSLFDGVFEFTAERCGEGEIITVQLDYGQAIPAGARLFKFDEAGRTTAVSATIAGSVVSYTVSDGGPLDADGAVNGEIVDPVGLVLVPAEVPGLSTGATAALAALVLALAVFFLYRRPRARALRV
jgi:hypothetical protein